MNVTNATGVILSSSLGAVPTATDENPITSVSQYIQLRDQSTSLLVRIYRAIVKAWKYLFENSDRRRGINEIIANKIQLGSNAKERHVLHVAFKQLFQEESYLKKLGINKEKVLDRDVLLDVQGLDPKIYAERELQALEEYRRTHTESPLSHIDTEKHRELLKKAFKSLFKEIVKKDRGHSQRLMLDDELSLREQQGMDLLLKVSSHDGQVNLTKKEKRKLKAFLRDADANVALNRRIENLLNGLPKDKFEEKGLTALFSIHTYTYKTKQIKPFIKSAEKLTALVAVIKKNPKATIEDSAKLNLEELGLLTSMVKLNGLINFLGTAGLIEEDSKLHKLQGSLRAARSALTYVDRKFSQQAGYDSGDLLMYRGKDYSKFLNKELDKMVGWQLSWLGSDYFHSALLNVPKKIIHISHVTDAAYEYNDIKAAQGAYTDAFRLRFDGLVGEEMKTHLTKVAQAKNKKDDWNALITKKFHEIIQKMHEDRAEFEKIKNSKWRRLMSGIMAHTRRNWLFMDVKKPFDRPFFQGKTDMICSEFAAKVLISALVQLNKELEEEVAEHLAKEGISAEEAKAKVGKPIVAIPIPETEKLKRLHTARLMDYLKPHLVKLERPPIIGQILAV